MSPRIFGILLFLLALLLFAILDASAKYLTAFYAVPFLVWARYAVHLVVMLVAVAPSQGRALITTRHPWLMVVRALLLCALTLFAQLAFRVLPLAETTAIVFITPLLVALLAGPMLGETVTKKSWLATLAGFAGVMLITRPGSNLDPTGVACALAGAVCYALYQILTRRLAASETPLRQLFYTALIGTLAMSLVLPGVWPATLPTPFELLLLVGLGLCGGIGHFLLIRALRETPASLLAPLLYVQLVWAALLGWWVFGDVPDAWTALGMGIIGASGLSLVLGRRKTV